MGKDRQLLEAISRLDHNIDSHRGRMGLIQRCLDEHGTRLHELEERIDASLARIDALLAAARSRP